MAIENNKNIEIGHGFFFLKYLKVLREKNRLENEVETLRNVIESQLYKIFMDKLEEPAELERYKNENKQLRKKNKILKDILKEEKPEKKKSKKRK